jgi:Tol biopolymer transport system component
MAPEQVEGAEADARSDIFALGCVLYEMLAGTVAFEGRSSAGIMAAILEREPVRLATRRADLPPLLVDTVEKCLAKNPDDRWQSAADAATALRWASAAGSGPDLEPTQASERSGRRLPQLIVGTLVALVSLAAGALLARQYLMPGAPPGAETRFEIAPPPDMMWTPAPVASTAQVALSPDGRRLAFVAADRRASPQIWIRELDSIQARPLAGTDDASFPFWSPDSRFVGFFAGGKLKTIEIAGGTPQAIADASLGRGGTWNQEGVIIYSQGSTSLRMWRVAAAGGSAAPLTPLPREQFATAQTWPAFLPDGRRFIYYQRSDKPEFQGIYASALGSSESKLVIRSDGLAMPAQGHVLVVREGSLFAHALDEATLEPRGTPVRIADGVGYSLGIIGYTPVSAAGRTLTYGPSIRVTTALQWRDRAGSLAGHEMARGVYRSPRLSSDGRQVAVSMLEGQSTSPEIWILDAVRGTATRITNDPASDWFPVWAPGVDRIFFGSARERATNIFQRHLIGTAPEDEQPLIDGVTGGARYPLDATGDGRLIFQSTDIGGYGLAVVGLEKERTPTVVLETQFNEVQARVSPNNRWIAYASDESGRFEVYVRGLPPAKGQWTISPSGGMQPEWSRSGRELFYISSDLKLMAVSVTEDASGFSAGVPRPLFDVDIPDAIAPFPGDYAVSADGQRFLVNTVVDQAKQPSLSVVMNWTAGLRR